MLFQNTNTWNWEGAMRGMRFPMSGIGDTVGEVIGEKDLDLAQRLFAASKANLAHSKFLRQILVSVDISAPLYFWSEMDTYKIGTTANSESTMHTLIKRINTLSLEDFEFDTGIEIFIIDVIDALQRVVKNEERIGRNQLLRYLKQMLPTSYIQKRHWTANYEVIRNIYNQRHDHRLTEWSSDFVTWAEALPYAEEFIIR